VLLLGSYPAEVSDNLSHEQLDPNQPTTVDGHEFYLGRLLGHRVILGVAEQAPSAVFATTALALKRFPCISAVVFEGTAGGNGHPGPGVGDVTVPSRWTQTGSKTFDAVDPKALAVARSIVPLANSQLGTMAEVNDGPCACDGVVESLKVLPLLRTPKVLVGGDGITDNGGQNTPCSADGGMLGGCNPCPPVQTLPPVDSMLSAGGATTSDAAATTFSEMAKNGLIVPDPSALLAEVELVPPPNLTGYAGPQYVADDEQTTASMKAADADHVPFIAFRGISDTPVVGDLWPFEFLVYQGIAADNAAVAARLWISRWPGR
jgi:nucleoside phosphorylase